MYKTIILICFFILLSGCASTETFVAYQGWHGDTSYVYGWYTYGKIKNGKYIHAVEEDIKNKNGFSKVIVTCISRLK